MIFLTINTKKNIIYVKILSFYITNLQNVQAYMENK